MVKHINQTKYVNNLLYYRTDDIIRYIEHVIN